MRSGPFFNSQASEVLKTARNEQFHSPSQGCSIGLGVLNPEPILILHQPENPNSKGFGSEGRQKFHCVWPSHWTDSSVYFRAFSVS